MNAVLTLPNDSAEGLLLLLLIGVVALLGATVHQLMSLRRERRAHSGQLSEQLGRVQVGLQKINSSIIAQTNGLKERLGVLGPAIEQAEHIVREATAFTTEFKAVRTDLQKFDERLAAVGESVANAVAAQAGQPVEEHLAPLVQQVSTLQHALAEAAQTQQSVAGELRTSLQAVAGGQERTVAELRSLTAGQGHHTRELRGAIERDLRQVETRMRELTEKFLSESAQLRSRMDNDTRALLAAPARQIAPSLPPTAQVGLDDETRKEFRKLAERIDGLQRRLEDIIRL